ncbi:uncharacterized protein LOC141691377 [Apium graveolens]|uniref:uncharacterized protein LOC141691377 n=1 Tax=Apium graveolens TaxID=4045 RepID=UPI003D793CD3
MSTDSISQEEFLKMQEDMAQLRDLVKMQSRFEAPVESPLSRSIEKAKIDRTLKTPTVDQFDGSTDPSGFLNTFDGRMAFYGHSEVARCQFFSTCLQGTALHWYNNLPSRSIDSWTTLKTKFQTRFSSNYKRDLEEPLAVNYLVAGIDGIRHGILLEELIEKHPQHLHAAFQIVEHRMTLQEAMGSIRSPRRSNYKYDRSRTHSPRTPRSRRYDSKSPRRSSPRRDTGNEKFQSPRGREYQRQPVSDRKWQPRDRKDKEFTKLTVNKATILAILKTEPGFRPPRPMKPGRPPSSRYCDYHEDTGHTTEQCYQLSNLIESKIRRGHFVHYIEGQDQN